MRIICFSMALNSAWISSSAARSVSTTASISAWKALRLARLSSLLPCSLAACGETSWLRRAVSVRKVRNSAARLMTASNAGNSSSGTRGRQSVEKRIHLAEVLHQAFGEGLGFFDGRRRVDAAQFHHYRSHEAVQAFAVEGAIGGVVELDEPGVILRDHGQCHARDSQRDQAHHPDDEIDLASNFHGTRLLGTGNRLEATAYGLVYMQGH